MEQERKDFKWSKYIYIHGETGEYAICFKEFKLFGIIEMKYRDWQKVNMKKLTKPNHYGHQLSR